MPRAGQKGVTMDTSLAAEWKQTATSLGYGEKGMQKFLRVVLEVAKAHPSLFRKR